MATRIGVGARKPARQLRSHRHPEARGAQRRASKGDGPCPSSFEGGLQPPPQDDGAGQGAAPRRKPRHSKPARAIESRRLQMTPALYDNVRHRFEHTSEPIEGMAADLGCTAQTVCNIANREGWVRHVPPPRDLSPAAKLAAQAEAAVASRRHPEVAGEAGPRRMHGPGLSFFEARAPNGALAPQNDGENQSSAVSLPGGGEERKQGGGSGEAAQDAPPRIAETAQALHRELLQMLADVKAERERMKREGYGRHDLREMSGTIASLGAVLRTLQPVLGATPQRHGDDHDDIPDDIDEFREALARRIEAFMDGETDAGDAGGDAAASSDGA